MPTVSAHVARTLAAHIDHVFGVMGNGNAYFLDALERETGRALHRGPARSGCASSPPTRTTGPRAASPPRQPPTAPGSPTRSPRSRRRCRRTSRSCSSSATSPPRGPRPWDVDQIALASAVGARTYTVGRADAAATTVIAIEHALTYRVPTVLAIPYDVAALDAGPVPDRRRSRACPRRSRVRGPFAEQAIARHRRRPARPRGGRSCSPDAAPGSPAPGEALGALADATGALTASTALGRGIFPRPEFDLGVTGGFGAEAAMDARPRGRRRRRLRRLPQPVHDAVRRAVRPGHAASSRSTSRPRRPTRTSAATCAADAAVVARGRDRELALDGRALQRLARVRRRRRPRARTTAATADRAGRPPRPAHRPRRASASCCPRTASSSRTAGTSSAGRTCTGRSPRPTG